MTKIILNGQERELADANIPALLAAEAVPEAHWQSLAIAHNGQVVPRANWANVQIESGDKIEIVKPFVGG